MNQIQLLAQNDSLNNTSPEEIYTEAIQLKNTNPVAALAAFTEITKSSNNQTLKAKAFKEIGYLLFNKGDLNNATLALKTAADLSKSLNNELLLADCEMGLGNINYLSGNLAQAATFFLSALKVYENQLNITGLNSAYSSLGDLYYRQNNFTKAIEYNLKAVRLFEGKKDKLRQAGLYENLGSLYYKQNKLNESRNYYIKALNLFIELGNKAAESTTLQNLGDISFQLNNLVQASEYYQKSLKIATAFKAKPLIAQNLIDLGSTYYEEQNYANAILAYKQAIDIAQKNNLKIELDEAYEGISLVYKAINNQNKSQSYSKLSKSIKDSLYNDSALKAIADLQLLYDAEVKESEIELLNKNDTIKALEISRQKQINNFLVALSLLLILLVSVFIYYNINNRKTNKKLEAQFKELTTRSEQIELQRKELEQLNQVKDRFFSIISHDLRNNLATMRLYFDYISNKKHDIAQNPHITKQISESVENTIDLLENLLVWASNQIKGVPLYIEELNLYEIAEETLNFLMANAANKEIVIKNDIDFDATAMGDRNMIQLVFRNLISNAIKFTPIGGEITIINESEGDFAKIMVIDNGVGIKKQKLEILFTEHANASTKGTANEKGTGLGLMLCKEFIEKNNGKIWAESEPDKGSCFYFTLPIKLS